MASTRDEVITLPYELPRVDAVAEVRKKNQLTIPKPIVEALALEPGDRLVFEIYEGDCDTVQVRKLPRSYLGLFADVFGTAEETEEYLRGEREAWEE